MSDHCETMEVILQENNIVRDKEGNIIGHLIEDIDKFAEKHYNRGFNSGWNEAQELYQQGE
jgi:hypothetical protein